MTTLNDAIARAHHAHRHDPCVRCKGTGQYQKYGSCFRCRGKGYLDATDRRRNAKYDSHALRDALERAFATTGQLPLL